LDAGGANEFKHLFIAVEGLGSPVLGDLGEQTMLDGIPFGGAGRVVSDRNSDTECVAQLSLDFSLPGPGSAAVAASRVRQNQKLGSGAIAPRSFAFPPSGDGMDGEGWRVVRDANTDGAAVVRWVVNAVGDAHPRGVRAEVVIVHRNWRAIPFSAGLLKLPISSRFLLSTLMIGRPCRWKRVRSEQICWNC